MDNKSYKTRQREILLEFFKSNSDKCFLAKDIIKNSSMVLGEATIYRTLAKFVEENYSLEKVCKDRVEFYKKLVNKE